MLFAALVFPLLARAAVLPEIIHQDDTVKLVKDVNVPVTLGVMSRCPDAIACETVFDKVLERVGNKVDISLSFLGTVNASEPLYGVSCLHGEFECAGNIHELCAIAHTSSHNEWWPFLRCLNYQGRNQIGLEDVGRKCARIVGLDWDQSGIGACVSGEEGKRLLRESVENSKQHHITPCIDLHGGMVKQIVGGTLSNNPSELKTNFVASDSAASFARLYRMNHLEGGHVIKLGPGNDTAAREALKAWPGALQVGGGITEANAQEWLDAGASKAHYRNILPLPFGSLLALTTAINVPPGRPRQASGRRKLQEIRRQMGRRNEQMARSHGHGASLDLLSQYCSEFLVHAADVEGLCQGIDEALVARLGEWSRIPVTYAGGARDISDLDLVERLSHGRVDLTFGSSLDIFGGTQVSFAELVTYSNSRLNQ